MKFVIDRFHCMHIFLNQWSKCLVQFISLFKKGDNLNYLEKGDNLSMNYLKKGDNLYMNYLKKGRKSIYEFIEFSTGGNNVYMDVIIYIEKETSFNEF